jgi:hypothetical protein
MISPLIEQVLLFEKHKQYSHAVPLYDKLNSHIDCTYPLSPIYSIYLSNIYIHN